LDYPSAEVLQSIALKTKLTSQENSQLVDFIFNDEQKLLADSLETNQNIIVLKSRQIGVSTITGLFDLVCAIMNERTKICVCLDTNSKAQAFIAKIQQFCNDLELTTVKSNSKYIELENGSTITALSANGGGKTGKSTVGRSMTFDLLHITELAFFENTQAFAALKATCPNGRIIIESTANGPTGTFADLWHDKNNNYHKVFFSVELHKTYRKPADTISDVRWAELQVLGFRDRASAAWWHHAYSDSGQSENDFLRDFCVLPEQPFQLSTGKVFDEKPQIGVLSKNPGEPCIISCDIAKGKGGDNTVLMVVSRVTNQVLDMWFSNQQDVFFVGNVLSDLHKTYSPSLILVEKNGVGKGFLEHFASKGLPVSDVITTDATKETGFSNVRKQLRANTPLPVELATEIANLRFENNRYYGTDDFIMCYSFALNHLAQNPYRPAQSQTIFNKLLIKNNYY